MTAIATSWKENKSEGGMNRALCSYMTAIASVIVFAFATPAPAQDAAPEQIATPAPAQDATAPEQIGTPAPAPDAAPDRDRKTRSSAKDADADAHTPKPVHDAAEPDHFRGQVTKVEATSIDVQINGGQTVRLGLADNLTIFKLSKGSFTTVDFGTYVGAVGVKLEEYSPIVRDSLSWLHRGFELRIIDEQLRGIAVGHKKWDLTSDSIIAHGWVDDMEARVLSIKWGPTELEETDVEVGRDVPVLKMSLGDKSLIRPGAHVFAGAQKGADGNHTAVFVFVGNDGVVPPL